MTNETVFCIKRDFLPESWVQKKSVVPMGLDVFIEKCATAGFEFINRLAAEKDPSYKQIIPYIILQTTDFEKTAIYNRQGNEQRLHDLWSIGIGGHINPVDMETQTTSFHQILITGMERELNEELDQRPKAELPKFVGVISEEITDVGKVHLGAVFRILTTAPEKYLPGSELFQFAWKKTKNLKELNLELWSKLALKLISES
ncbi:MAG: phosphoesterase [Proteobacteria bacterium]|nr:phosphoesterase [Pseudomonadota bacterium]MBU1584761.1 phosphoesterase [Pseudomonadota bacterium]MBU2455836.1 phosphoesterase [Pseudomonadota bacterium]MBU2630490.1 phosphoesterase [Pseudomonadota bacterium]